MKVRFIYPGAEWAYSKKRVESDPFSPPLGILYLASILENAGHDVTVTDFYAEPYTKQRLKEVLAGADLIGMTLTSFTMKDALPMAKAIKSMAPDVPFVVGGPHVTLYPTKSIDLTGADITVAGEAEDSILPLVKTISEGGPQDPRLKEITGVSFKTKDGIVSGPPGSYVKDLDTVPFPDRSLVKDYNYGHLLGSKISKGRFTTIITSRGCPMRCRFCTRMVVSMGKYRARSAENVIEEVKKVHEEGYETVMFVDDNFMALRKRTIKMLDGLIKADLGMEFIAQGRVDGVDDEVFTKMRKAGIRVLLLGIESGNQEVLDFYRKKTTLAQIEKCVGTGLRFIYLDWHMSSNGGGKRPEIVMLFQRLCREYRLLYTHDAQDIDGRYSGAKYFGAGLEAWGTVRLPDGKLAYWCGPDLPEATRLKFLDTLRNLQPGTWYTVSHPGLYARRQAQSVAVLCSKEVKDIIQSRNIRLISYADLWNRQFGAKSP